MDKGDSTSTYVIWPKVFYGDEIPTFVYCLPLLGEENVQ